MEREAESKLSAQRDEFAKHERSLRERIVQLQTQVAESRDKSGRAKGSGADGDGGALRLALLLHVVCPLSSL